MQAFQEMVGHIESDNAVSTRREMIARTKFPGKTQSYVNQHISNSARVYWLVKVLAGEDTDRLRVFLALSSQDHLLKILNWFFAIDQRLHYCYIQFQHVVQRQNGEH